MFHQSKNSIPKDSETSLNILDISKTFEVGYHFQVVLSVSIL